MFWAMVHGHYISIEKREKQSHSCVEVTVVIPPHKEEREPLEQVTSLIPLLRPRTVSRFLFALLQDNAGHPEFWRGLDTIVANLL